MGADFSDPEFVASITATLSTIMLVAVQAGLGCTVTIRDLRDNLKRPVAVGIGLFAQVLLMPLIAYGLASALRMKGDDLLGLALVATTPGGSMSNVFSYYSRGNMALSITLTVLSNLLAFGTMPLAILVLAPDSQVPFVEIVKTLALTIGPTAFGIALKTYSARLALWGEKLGAGIGGVAVLGAIISGIAGNANRLGELPPELFISTSLLGVLGMGAAWILAFAGRIHGSRRCAARPGVPPRARARRDRAPRDSPLRTAPRHRVPPRALQDHAVHRDGRAEPRPHARADRALV
jgi:BASS family bile acid:Na+ symporter